MINSLKATAALAILPWCVLLATSASALPPTPEQKCQSGKNKVAGQYAACLQKAEAKRVSTGDLTKYSAAVEKCEFVFTGKWQKLTDATTAASATCPDAPLTSAQFKAVIDEHSDNITTALNGGGLDDCPSELPQCQSDLAACLSSSLPDARVLKTGETSCYDPSGSGSSVSCSGTGQDGDLQKGVVRSYTDNGDGTITDNQTGLTWEKKSNDGSIHDMGTLYTWSDAFSVFIAGLNTANFGGHNDWRLPNRFELESLVDLGQENPSADPAFNSNCVPGCLVANCNCTAVDAPYWCSTAIVPTPNFAWVVMFNFGGVNSDSIQFGSDHVRAVRGGL